MKKFCSSDYVHLRKVEPAANALSVASRTLYHGEPVSSYFIFSCAYLLLRTNQTNLERGTIPSPRYTMYRYIACRFTTRK